LVEVFQGREAVGGQQLLVEFGGKLPLLLNGSDDRLAAFIQLPQFTQQLHKIADLLLVQTAGHLLAIAGDEGQGIAGIEQFDGSCDFLRWYL